MYELLTFYHNSVRWLVCILLIIALIRAGRGYWAELPFTKTDSMVRYWTGGVAHLQLLLGMLLYFLSPLVRYFFAHRKEGIQQLSLYFFPLLHGGLMLLAIVLITIGSAVAKRQVDDLKRFRSILVWYGLAFLLIVIAVPWPFSPLAARPYFR
jgi:amino acid transporter